MRATERLVTAPLAQYCPTALATSRAELAGIMRAAV